MKTPSPPSWQHTPLSLPSLPLWLEVVLVILLLAGGLAVRLDHIRLPLIDHHTFRQGTEAMMARHFYRDGIVLQYPRIDGYSAQPRIFVNEFPLFPATVATLYRVFGEREILGRLVSVAASLATGLLCYAILRMGFNNTVALAGLLLFFLSPLGGYVGRCYLRHPMAFFFQVLAFYAWLKWLENSHWRWWLVTWLSGAITVLMNFANAYIGLPMLVALWAMNGMRGLADRRVWALAAGILLPAYLWLRYALEFGAWFLVAGDTGSQKARDLGRVLGLEWMNSAFFDALGRGLWDLLLTPIGCFLGLLGLFVYWRSPFVWVIRVWCLTVLVYFCVDHYPIYINPHEYYFVHGLAPAALLGGIALIWILDLIYKRFSLGSMLTALVVLLILSTWSWYHCFEHLRKQYLIAEPGWIQHWPMAGRKVQELTPPDAILIVDQPEDALIYYCDRPGWVNRWQNLTEEALRSLIAHGARYLLITTYLMEGDQFTGFLFDDPVKGSPCARWVRENCRVVHDGLTFQIIDLKPGG